MLVVGELYQYQNNCYYLQIIFIAVGLNLYEKN
jgi:hypothetical protein